MTAELKHTLTLAPVDPDDVYEDEERPEVGPTWEVRTLDDADFALRRIGEFRREQAENVEVAEAQIARIKARLEDLNARLDRGARYFESRLRLFAESNRGTLLIGKRKSRALFHGSLGWRAKPERLKVVDEAALIAWARKQPVEAEVLRVTEKPALAAIQKHYATTGEVPDGAEVEPEADEFYTKGE